MNRQNQLKDNMENISIKKNMQDKYMDVKTFFNTIELENDNKSFYRYINVKYNSKGSKIPSGEKNNLSIEDIKNDRGNSTYNTLSLAVKHIPNLYVVDYDTKEVYDDPFYDLLNNDCVACTETKKGSHYYIKIKNISEYTNQQKININSDIEVDLIKKNNIWETIDRKVTGTIKEYDWNDIKIFFNVKKMNFTDLPSTPPSSPIFNIDNNYDADEINYILSILPFECYEYDTWIKIGMAIHNITNHDNIGFSMYSNWSKKDKDNFDIDLINKNWNYWTNKNTGNKLGLTYLKNLKYKYTPTENASLECIFQRNFNDCSGTSKYKQNFATNQMLKELNNRLIFIKDTGDHIIIDGKNWFLKNNTKTREHLAKEKFTFNFKDESSDDWEKLNIDPFKLWTEWSFRKEVLNIGFDPTNNNNDNIFNLWKGFRITKDISDDFFEDDALPILDHIKYIWCKGDLDHYEYVLNYFAHIIQKPHIKTGVLLALKSKQGAGKNIILNILNDIIGDDHYCQNSNSDFLFGSFNGQLEGKILINLDEMTWGGDKKLEGVIKNKITETKQTINKKNKENYVIDCYANYIITTNNDWFIGTTEDDRRNFCLELDNKYSSISDSSKTKYFNLIRNCPSESFAKILYNRDITNFNPRSFKKTKLLQEQVERSWTSPKVWWNNCLQDGGFYINDTFIEWNNIGSVSDGCNFTQMGTRFEKKNKSIVVYSKEELFKIYNSHTYDSRKFAMNSFFRDIIQNCLGDLYCEKQIQINKERSRFILLPSLHNARMQWNKLQKFDYQYIDYCDTSDDEEWTVV